MTEAKGGVVSLDMTANLLPSAFLLEKMQVFQVLTHGHILYLSKLDTPNSVVCVAP